MAGGFPISAVIGRAEVMDAPAAGGLGGTYAAARSACAAALAVLEVFERGEAAGAQPRARRAPARGLRQLAQRHDSIAEIRGLGAMVAMELCRDGDPGQPHADLAKARRRGRRSWASSC